LILVQQQVQQRGIRLASRSFAERIATRGWTSTAASREVHVLRVAVQDDREAVHGQGGPTGPLAPSTRLTPW